MQPTMKLRQLWRVVDIPRHIRWGYETENVVTHIPMIVTQQWWEGSQGFGATPEEFNRVVGEWRDVPIEEE